MSRPHLSARHFGFSCRHTAPDPATHDPEQTSRQTEQRETARSIRRTRSATKAEKYRFSLLPETLHSDRHYLCCMPRQNIIAMTKAEIVKEIVRKTGVKAVTAAAVVERTIAEIRRAMIDGENVYLRGFGSFIVKERAQKMARDITRNKTIVVPARRIAAFRPSKELLKKIK